ncbi:MAG: hypothetical protein H7Y42_15195 [Chitinophagaceae bacterium]|nr:hypothetical protein [Chitinophagaceae bacterium]
MRAALVILTLFFFTQTCVRAQELYVYTEPASNMPANSISAKLTGMFMGRQPWHDRPMQRYMPEVMLGLNKNLMLHVGGTIGDMHTSNITWESVFLYGKYRFLSRDEIHRHFRMAAFADVSYSRVPFHNDEVSLQGDKSGVQAGIIATQLWNRLAVSGTVSHTQVLHTSRNSKNVIYVPSRIYQVMNYSFSAGYLVLPREYTDYKQLNVNVYAEVLAQQSLDRKAYYLDLAPAIQLIFNSNMKVNLGYRFELAGDMTRMATRNNWLISLERTFLNALKKK